MKKILLTISILLGGGALGSFATVQLAPAVTLDLARQAARSAAGMSPFDIQVGNHRYSYLDSAPEDNTQKPTVLMIHGFNADKDNWPRMGYFLQDKYRLVAIDLLGHGDSDGPMNVSYQVSAQADRVHEVVKALKLKPHHVIGNSMGGQIAGFYAANYPDSVLSLTLFNNAGINSPIKSELRNRLEAGQPNPLTPTDPDKANEFFAFVFNKPPYIPDSVKREYVEKSKLRKPLSDFVFKDLILENYEDLALKLPKIKAPTQIVWGQKDRVLHVSSIDVMKPLLPNAKVTVLEDIGHAPMMEAPEEAAQLLHEFIDALNDEAI